MRVLIDPGHGGLDPGAVHGGIVEAVLNLEAARDLCEILQTFGHWASLTRWRDGSLPLNARSGLENRLAPDCFLSIHANAAENTTARGFEIWTSPGETAADPLAHAILDAVARELPDLPLRREAGPHGPDKEGGLHVLTRTRAPAVLVEMEFLSHPTAREWITQPAHRRALMLAVARGTMEWGGGRS